MLSEYEVQELERRVDNCLTKVAGLEICGPTDSPFACLCGIQMALKAVLESQFLEGGHQVAFTNLHEALAYTEETIADVERGQ